MVLAYLGACYNNSIYSYFSIPRKLEIFSKFSILIYICQEALAALAEVCSMRFVHGVRSRTGLMGIDYPTAAWLYRQA